jgi:hypothetical protein
MHYLNMLDMGRLVNVYEEEQLSHRDSIRGAFTVSGRLRDRYTSVEVIGRDKFSKRVISAFAIDKASLARVGYDRRQRVTDEGVNTWSMLYARTRWEFLRLRAENRGIGFETSGPDAIGIGDVIVPHESRTTGGSGAYVCIAFRERCANSELRGQVDALDARSFLIESVS